MKFLVYIAVLLYNGVVFAADQPYLSCQQIRNGIEWSFDYDALPQEIVAGSTFSISSELKITEADLFKDTLFISFSSDFQSSLEPSFQVNSYHNMRLSDDLIDKLIDTPFTYTFHGGTAGEFQIKPLTILFVSKMYQSTKCLLDQYSFDLIVKNKNQVDMNPPQITAVDLKKDVSTGHWLLALDIEDSSAIQLFEPSDSFIPHFTLKNIDTSEEHLCFNKNLRQAQENYEVDLFVSNPNDSLRHLPAGNYRLLGFNRADVFGNFIYDVTGELSFTAESSFYCRDQE